MAFLSLGLETSGGFLLLLGSAGPVSVSACANSKDLGEATQDSP